MSVEQFVLGVVIACAVVVIFCMVMAGLNVTVRL